MRRLLLLMVQAYASVAGAAAGAGTAAGAAAAGAAAGAAAAGAAAWDSADGVADSVPFSGNGATTSPSCGSTDVQDWLVMSNMLL